MKAYIFFNFCFIKKEDISLRRNVVYRWKEKGLSRNMHFFYFDWKQWATIATLSNMKLSMKSPIWRYNPRWCWYKLVVYI
jgi:hypothetical protein